MSNRSLIKRINAENFVKKKPHSSLATVRGLVTVSTFYLQISPYQFYETILVWGIILRCSPYL